MIIRNEEKSTRQLINHILVKFKCFLMTLLHTEIFPNAPRNIPSEIKKITFKQFL